MRPLQRLVNQPEFSFFIFGVLLNFPWEFLQVPFFKGLPDAPHWDAVRLCAWATLGDGIIILIGYWTTAAAWRDRWWFMRPAVLKLAAFIAVGLIITILLEQLATSSSHPVWRWRYSEMMPLIPGIGIGLTPFLQWILIPPLVVWFSRRQLG